MHTYDPALTDLVVASLRDRLRNRPALNHPGEKDKLDGALAGLIGPEGNDPEEVLRLWTEQLAPTVVAVDSPRFLSFVPAAPTQAAVLFDTLVSCASIQGVSWLLASGPVAAENQVLRLLADLAGMPAEAGGCFVSGGSAGNLSALVTARDTARRRRGLGPYDRVRIAVSDQAHSSIANTLRIIGVEPFAVPTADHRLTGSALRAALLTDTDPSGVIGVVATAGTTNAGIIDDLTGIASVACEFGLWFHVDGAYGGAGLLAPSVRDRYRGIEHADSLVIDPHKWLFAPFDCAALLYRDPSLARAAHTQDASYLDALHTDDDTQWNPSDYAHHLSRRARGLPLWFSLAVHGTRAYSEAIEKALTLARDTATLIRKAPHLELIREPELSAVLFRRVGWEAQDYAEWSARLLAGQTAFVAPTGWEGETVARFAFLHPETTLEVVEEIVSTMT
ncbi:aspartate aminotransferase family protein [Streptomyces sp. ISL-66]|uniref:pyridoxal phosphate-dependent decarboxylase family protein n=1 Tax=Streptomyces sp. ISL-66 TaxID=2819186 RepID=UPI001BEC2099|nr:pyridoxal-dependent decarboxylase [Streptomyces sp. ISL-66]MBT2468207.1 aspartate aminotransferase family protein [Streptomyces sp. ISL-66]